jgi:hypothetical protein
MNSNFTRGKQGNVTVTLGATQHPCPVNKEEDLFCRNLLKTKFVVVLDVVVAFVGLKKNIENTESLKYPQHVEIENVVGSN